MASRHRNQIRVERVIDNTEGLFLEVCLAGWNPHRVVVLDAGLFPSQLIDHIERSPGPDEGVSIYIHCVVDMSAERGQDLRPEGPFELSKVRFEEEVGDDMGVVVVDRAVYEHGGRTVGTSKA